MTEWTEHFKRGLFWVVSVWFLCANLGCDETQMGAEREYTIQELQVMSKQWCAETSVTYNTGLAHVTSPTIIKLDLTDPGSVQISTVTTRTDITPIKQHNVIECYLAETNNALDCYGVGQVKLELLSNGRLKINLIAEAQEFSECVENQLNKF